MVKQYGLVFDLRRCIGCHTCVIACKLENNLDKLHSSWMKIFTSSGAPDMPTGKYPELSLSWQPITCMHCQNPPCAEACPEDAIYKRPDGIVLINEGKCNGCQLCLTGCPYDVIQFNPEDNRSEKCNLCSHRIAEGLQPFCVKECVWGAIHFGDIGDPHSDVSRLLSSRKSYILQPEKCAKPSNYYLV